MNIIQRISANGNQTTVIARKNSIGTGIIRKIIWESSIRRRTIASRAESSQSIRAVKLCTTCIRNKTASP